jgi:hypothetical protein
MKKYFHRDGNLRATRRRSRGIALRQNLHRAGFFKNDFKSGLLSVRSAVQSGAFISVFGFLIHDVIQIAKIQKK